MALRRLRCLFSFLTRIPAGCSSLEEAARGYPLVPVVGLAEGLLVAAVLEAAIRSGAPPAAAAAAALAAHLWVTGCLHLDGFADYSDALGAGARGEEALRIMKDPRRGGFAVALTAAVVVARYAGLASHPSPAGLVAAYLSSAEAMYAVSSLLPPPPYRGVARVFHDEGTGRRGAAVSAAAYALPMALVAAADPVHAGLAAAAAWAAALLAARDARARLGYANGDVLGFVYEASGAAGVLAAAWRAAL